MKVWIVVNNCDAEGYTLPIGFIFFESDEEAQEYIDNLPETVGRYEIFELESYN